MLRHRCGWQALWERHLPWLIALLMAMIAHSGSPASADDAEQTARGRELFTHVWRPHDPKSHGGDGLGPRYNERSCVACHFQKGIGGGGPLSKNVQIFGVTVPEDGSVAPESVKDQIEFLLPGVSSQPFVLHRLSTSRQYAAWRSKRLWFADAEQAKSALLAATKFRRERVRASGAPVWQLQLIEQADRERIADLAQRGHSSSSEDLIPIAFGERNTTALFGAGLLATIPRSVLEDTAQHQPINIRGRVSVLPGSRVGRFGWKAQNATLLDFNMNACAVELGLDNPVHRQSVMTMESKDAGIYNDLTTPDCEDLTAFVASLPQPPDIEPRLDNADLGEGVFEQIGCAVCHVRNLGPVKGIYSDLLLHKLGLQLSGHAYYGVSQTVARSNEWRTPPLWGCADSAPYMHDGRAATLNDAILAHDDQAEDSVEAFKALQSVDKKLLLTFLQSLHAPRPPDVTHKNSSHK